MGVYGGNGDGMTRNIAVMHRAFGRGIVDPGLGRSTLHNLAHGFPATAPRGPLPPI